MKKFCLALLIFGLPAAASAQSVVLGSSGAYTCYKITQSGNPGEADAIKTCENALGLALLTKDLAATHVNIGILYMRNGEFTKSRDHYSAAIQLAPELSEAYINYGAALIHLDERTAAIETLTKAISFSDAQTANDHSTNNRGMEKLPEAYFNRAIAHDRNQNYKAAYLDFKRALDLRPEWPPAVAAIKRYDIKKAS